MPRLPARIATEPVGIPEWDTSVERIRNLIEAFRRQRASFRGLLGDIRGELRRLSHRARDSGKGFENLSQALYRMSQEFDSYDIRTTATLQEISIVDQEYQRIVDNPFNRTAAQMSHDLTNAWGRTLNQ